MTKIVISRADINAAYQKRFHYAPLKGWAIHIDGKFKGISPTQPEAIEKALTLTVNPDPQITIDCRGEANKVTGFIGLTGEAKIFQDLMTG